MGTKNKLAKTAVLSIIVLIAATSLISAYQFVGAEHIVSASPSHGSDSPCQIHLTWRQNDTSHTIVITWKTTNENSGDKVLYDTESQGGENSLYRYSENGSHHTYEGLGGYIHDVELTGLSSDTVYYFVCGGENGGYSEERSFRTAPSTSTSFTFVVGSDSHAGAGNWPLEFNVISHAMAQFNPSFALHAGDFVKFGVNQSEWDNFFEDIDEHWVGANGLTIPIIPALGNHDCYNENYDVDTENALSKYLRQFSLPGNELWYSLDWGPDLHIIVLDSENIRNKEQIEWLENDLAANASKKWKIVIFHRPPFTAGSGNTQIQMAWVPLFDNYHVNLVFNGHHHIYQRTYPINYTKYEDAPVSSWEGTTYIVTGGLGWSISSYETGYWWTASVMGTHHFILVNVSEDGLLIKAINMNGNTFDECYIPAEAPTSTLLLVVVAVAVVVLGIGAVFIVRRRRAGHTVTSRRQK